MRKRYVLGFLFENDLSSVVLIQKEKPAWQAKCRNGVGGEIKPDESEVEAMMREFNEEAGVLIDRDKWHLFCEMGGKGWIVYCFTCRDSSAVLRVRTMTEEKIFITNSKTFDGQPTIPNLDWLVPLAKDHIHNGIEASVSYLS
jgi:8-oxo-dGTP pyrophosphatase MutT (NUDIX family)